MALRRRMRESSRRLSRAHEAESMKALVWKGVGKVAVNDVPRPAAGAEHEAIGYSHLTGGHPGGRAEYTAVAFAAVNCLKVPDPLSDEQVLFPSDIVCTGWHATELGRVTEGETVAVWGCGPVGLMAQEWPATVVRR